MGKLKLCWNVYECDFNSGEIKVYNIFDHGRFFEDVKESLKKCKDKEDFKERIKRHLFYYFGSKCEWEVIITSWPPYISKEEVSNLCKRADEGEFRHRTAVNLETARKIDIREQVMLNFDVFIDYVWSKKKA